MRGEGVGNSGGPLALVLGIDANPMHQEFDHLPFRRQITRLVSRCDPILKAMQQKARIHQVSLIRLGKRLLGVHCGELLP